MPRRLSTLSRLLIVGIMAVLLAPALLALRPAPAAALDPDFQDTLVTNIARPTAFAFTPDGRMLIATQLGQLRVLKDGALLPNPALDLAARGDLCSNFERGLLGIAVDPAFTTNRFIYLYYSVQTQSACEGQPAINRVSRWVLADDNTAGNETILIDNIRSQAGNHNAGDLNFGKDGYLYVSVGDGGCDYADPSKCAGANDAARDKHTLLGKILRITKDGDIPPDNPFMGDESARCKTGDTTPDKWCQETFAWGLRNPFRFAFDPNAAATRFFINDVGQASWEEIDEGASGADYGWNVREGHCVRGSTTDCGPPPAGMTNPIHDYAHSTGCRSITGGAFVPNGVWPAEYTGAYLFGDYVCGKIFTLKQTSPGAWVRTEFVSGLGSSSAVHLRFGPLCNTQALYYTTYAGGGQVRRIAYNVGDNCPPTAALTAAPTNGPAPLTVNFDGSGSADPNAGDTLTYLWDFGDGATATTTTPTVSHTYTTVATRTASLRVRDNRGLTSAPATVQIGVGNLPPAPTIVSPAEGTLYQPGQVYTLLGSATDPQDGALPDSALNWQIILHHNEHTHPILGPVAGNAITFRGPIHEEGNNYLEIRLTATDAAGATATVSRFLYLVPGTVIFSDVPPTHPAYEAIGELAVRGIVRGYGDGRFGPDDISLRAQMAALIARAMGWSGEVHTNPFPDRGPVDDELWAAVATLAARGVALGYEDGTYNPTGDVLHIQVISFISRAMVVQGRWTAATADDPTIYPNVQIAARDRLDLVTYVRNAGAIPDRPADQNWADWDTPATRGWFARVLWQAIGGR
jgi:glucose/arabinose dehydrogenase